MILIPEIFLDNTIEVHKNVTVQVIIPKDPRREVSIAWTRNEAMIAEMEASADLVTDADAISTRYNDIVDEYDEQLTERMLHDYYVEKELEEQNEYRSTEANPQD